MSVLKRFVWLSEQVAIFFFVYATLTDWF